MTWPHDDAEMTAEQRKAEREGRGCGLCLYRWFGPKLRKACTHPEHACTDILRLTFWALGCPDRIPMDAKTHPGDPVGWPDPVNLADHVERLHEARLAACRGGSLSPPPPHGYEIRMDQREGGVDL